MRRIGVALLGFGTVGQGVVRLLDSNHASIARRRSVEFDLVGIGVSSLTKSRQIEGSGLTDDLQRLVSRDDVEIVIEAIGGLEPARSLLLSAITRGKSIATANKAVLATHGPELFDAAQTNGVQLRFESTVCAGVPIVAALDRQLAANNISRIVGILNGTTNYMLTRMTQEGLNFDSVLQDAQQLGYAEADPSSDVDGQDAAYKIAILGSIASGFHLSPEHVRATGIRDVNQNDIRSVAALGGRIRLIAEWRAGDGPGSARVEPIAVYSPSRLVDVETADNGAEIVGDQCGQLFISGSGAGGAQTASGLIGDAIEVAATLGSKASHSYPWKVSDMKSRWVAPPSRYTIVSSLNGATAKERLERLLAPIQIHRFAETNHGAAALSEPCDAQMIAAAIERDGGKCVSTVLRSLP